MGGQKFRRVRCTLFDVEHSMDTIDWSSKPDLRYIVGQLEKCPTTGSLHWQFYMEFTKGVSQQFVKDTVGSIKTSLRTCDADGATNRRYCTKDDTSCGRRFEWGTMGGSQGKRTDLEQVRDQILSGETTTTEILMTDPMAYHQYGRTMERLQELRNRQVFRTWFTEGIWYYGPTGTGKSRRAFEGYNPDTHYALNVYDNGWWDGYNGHEIVIIDDFRGNIPFAQLLTLADDTPGITVRRRYGAPMPYLAKKLIITSSLHPHEVYRNLQTNDRLEQIDRRFRIIYTGGQADGSGQGNTRLDHSTSDAVNQSIEI